MYNPKSVILKGNILCLARLGSHRKHIISVYVTCPATLYPDYEQLDYYTRDCSEIDYDLKDCELVANNDEFYIINSDGTKTKGKGKIKEIIEVFSDDLQYEI